MSIEAYLTYLCIHRWGKVSLGLRHRINSQELASQFSYREGSVCEEFATVSNSSHGQRKEEFQDAIRLTKKPPLSKVTGMDMGRKFRALRAAV